MGHFRLLLKTDQAGFSITPVLSSHYSTHQFTVYHSLVAIYGLYIRFLDLCKGLIQVLDIYTGQAATIMHQIDIRVNVGHLWGNGKGFLMVVAFRLLAFLA